MSGGVDAVTAVGQKDNLTFGGTWATGDRFTVVLANQTSGVVTNIGFGNISAIQPSFVLTYNKKVYLLANSTTYFSAINLPTTFNDLNASGDGFVAMTNQYAMSEPLRAIAPYQGFLSFFSRTTTQVWTVNADPALWSLSQLLDNIGTRAALSVKQLGDLDVMFLSDTGIRSLRARIGTANAFVNDIGSAIDQLVQTDLEALTDAQVSTACAIVEPSANRYWLYINQHIYVLSDFQSSKIIGWSQYRPTWSSGGVGNDNIFAPQKFEIYKGQVYARDDAGIYVYGGTDNNTYDTCPVTVTLPFLDAKTPGTNKTSNSIDLSMTGDWIVQGSMDYKSQNYVTIAESSTATFDLGAVDWNAQGTHFSLKATTTSAQRAVLSSLIWHYTPNEEK